MYNMPRLSVFVYQPEYIQLLHISLSRKMTYSKGHMYYVHTFDETSVCCVTSNPETHC